MVSSWTCHLLLVTVVITGTFTPCQAFHILSGTTTVPSRSRLFSKPPPKSIRTPPSQPYTRDDRDTTPVNEAVVLDLIQQRDTAIQFENAKKREHLGSILYKEHGVKVYDSVKMWTTLDSPPPQHVRRQEQSMTPTANVNIGPMEHGYQCVGKAIDPLICTLTISDIHELLAKRSRLQAVRNFADADAIRFELFVNGVELSDFPEKMWRADGPAKFVDLKHTLPLKPVHYTRESGDTQEMKHEVQLRIETLLKKRAVAMTMNDQNLVGALTFELYTAYGVAIDDNRLIWKIGKGFDGPWKKPEMLFPRTQRIQSDASPLLPILFKDKAPTLGANYTMSPFSQRIPPPEIVARMEELVNDIVILQKASRFEESNVIRDELWRCYEIQVDNKIRQWSVGGIFNESGLVKYTESEAQVNSTLNTFQGVGEVKERKESVESKQIESSESPQSVETKNRRKLELAMKKHPYFHLFQQSKLGNVLKKENLPTIENLIRYIDAHQLTNPNIVDRLMIRLDEEHGIAFNGMTWVLRLPNGVPVYLPKDLPEGFSPSKVNLIQEIVNMRNVEKFEKKNMFMPDILEEGLKATHKVVVDDHSRTWYIDAKL